MRSGEPIMEKSRSMGDLHHLRLTALLRETGRLEKARISGPASCVYDALGKLRQQSRTSGGPPSRGWVPTATIHSASLQRAA